MIEYIFAAEFDNEKGVSVKCCYPSLPKQLNENTLASYMIPDGVHKRGFDTTTFKLKMESDSDDDLIGLIRQEFNYRKPLVCLYKKKLNWNPLLKSENVKEKFEVTLIENSLYVQALKDQKSFNFKIAQIQEFALICESIITFKLDSEDYGFEFVDSKNANLLDLFFSVYLAKENSESKKTGMEKTFSFFNAVKVMKNKDFKRDALIRSIAICSSTINNFPNLVDALTPYLDAFMNLSSESKSSDLNLITLSKLLATVFQVMNNRIREYSLNRIYIAPDEMNSSSALDMLVSKSASRTTSQQTKPSPTDPSLIELINIFKEKTMTIYSGILSGAKIIFVSNEKSCQAICRLVQSCQLLVAPLNINSRVFPYEHLSDISFLSIGGYVAGVTNPLFRSRNDWWDLCCDVNEGIILDNEPVVPKTQTGDDIDLRIQALDYEFISDILKKIRENRLSEQQARSCFYHYTKHFVDFATNSSNLIDYHKEDKHLLESFEYRSNLWKKTSTYEIYEKSLVKTREMLKFIFGEKNLDIISTLNNFTEKRSLIDIDLFKCYSVLLETLKDPLKFGIFLQQLIYRKEDISVLTIGLFSSSNDVKKKTVELMTAFENSEYKKAVFSSLNYYTLSIYKSLRDVYISTT